MPGLGVWRGQGKEARHGVALGDTGTGTQSWDWDTKVGKEHLSRAPETGKIRGAQNGDRDGTEHGDAEDRTWG